MVEVSELLSCKGTARHVAVRAGSFSSCVSSYSDSSIWRMACPPAVNKNDSALSFFLVSAQPIYIDRYIHIYIYHGRSNLAAGIENTLSDHTFGVAVDSPTHGKYSSCFIIYYVFVIYLFNEYWNIFGMKNNMPFLRHGHVRPCS